MLEVSSQIIISIPIRLEEEVGKRTIAKCLYVADYPVPALQCQFGYITLMPFTLQAVPFLRLHHPKIVY